MKLREKDNIIMIKGSFSVEIAKRNITSCKATICQHKMDKGKLTAFVNFKA